MAVTVASIQTLVNQYIRDTSTNSVSAADRLAAITEATSELYTSYGFDFSNRTYNFDYFDSVHYYNLTSDVPAFADTVDLRHQFENDHNVSFTRKPARELSTEINDYEDDAFAIEYRDRKYFLVVSHQSKYPAKLLHGCDSLTANGTWQVGETSSSNTSDAENLTLDTIEFQEGTGSLNFDVDVSDSANNRATISNEDFTAVDLSDQLDIGSLLFKFWLPESTVFTSVTAYWGSSDSAYWSATVTTDIFGAAFTEQTWNQVKIDWADATKTGTPDETAIDYLRFDFNYEAGYGDQTAFRLDDIQMVRPEKLRLHYQTWYVGQTSTTDSTALSAFAATTNVPWFSGVYDFFDVYVAHKAAAILFREMSLTNDALDQDKIAEDELKKLKKKFPTSLMKPGKNFKVAGMNWNRRNRKINK